MYERLDRIKLDTGKKSALFERSEEGTELKGVFTKFKISDELSGHCRYSPILESPIKKMRL